MYCRRANLAAALIVLTASAAPAADSWQDPTAHTEALGRYTSQIGAGDGVAMQVALDFDRASGYLFAAVRWENDNDYSIYRSTDGGLTWIEHDVRHLNKPIIDIDLVAVGGYVYAAKVIEENIAVYLTRWDATASPDISASLSSVGAGGAVTDVALAANSDGGADWIYFALIQDNGALRMFWSEASDGQTWIENVTGITDAAGGLDFDWNHETSSMFLSFIATDDTVRVHRGESATHIKTFGTSWDESPLLRTAISVSGDDVVVVFNMGTAGGNGIGFASSTDGGDTWPWIWDWIEYQSSAWLRYLFPGVTARDGRGFGLVYIENNFSPIPDGLHFRWAPYGSTQSGEWIAAEFVTVSPVDGLKPPAMTWLPDGSYGIAYIDGNGGVFFDRVGAGEIFTDGFEFGDTSEWSSTVP